MFKTKQALLVFSFSVAKNSVNLSKNYYKILEVDTACDQKLIKNSYLKLVKKLHPDVNPTGKEKFTEVQEAYEVLSDQELKKYYDQNSACKSGSPNYGGSNDQQTHSTQSRTSQSKTGHQFYTHRTYSSQNPHDYFYTDNEPKQQQQKAKTQKRQQNPDYDEQQQQQSSNPHTRSTNFNKDEKRARSQASWQQYQRQKQAQEQRAYQHETAEQRAMRDRLKAMRGFTSSYNVMWARHHLRPSGITNSYEEKERKRQEEIRSLMPEKIRKFYDKLMEKIDKLADQ